MIAFIIYLLFILWFIRLNGFLGLFVDDRINKKQFTILFFLKALAVPVFYIVYKKLYGGIDNLDAGKFYNDVDVINRWGRVDFPSYVMLLLGLQDDTPGSYDYICSHINTHNWDNGTTKDYLYNDNRILIRFYSVLDFISFNSYFVLSLFSCFFSFIGITQLYKSLKHFFEGKEIYVLVILCLFPALWFYTGALLKEGITFFTLGCVVFQIKKIIDKKFKRSHLPYFVFLIFISCILKPYLLLFCILSFSLFFLIQKSWRIKHKIVAFLGLVIFFAVIVNYSSIVMKKRSLLGAALKHQRIFSGVAKGGIFLTNDSKFVRLNFDTTLITKILDKKDVYKINKNSPFMYWQNNRLEDTLICLANRDTVSEYFLVYKIAESSSNINIQTHAQGGFKTITTSLYYSLFFPLFYKAKSLMHLLASFENLAIVLSLIIISWGFFKKVKSAFLPFVFLFICFSICILIGLATPNSGAIFRYRAPVVVLILLAALYYINLNKREKEFK